MHGHFSTYIEKRPKHRPRNLVTKTLFKYLLFSHNFGFSQRIDVIFILFCAKNLQKIHAFVAIAADRRVSHCLCF